MTTTEILADMVPTSATYDHVPPIPPSSAFDAQHHEQPQTIKPLALPPLQRIPGMVDQGAPKRLASKDKVYSIADITSGTRSPNIRTRLASLKILGSLTGLNRSELHLAASTLYATCHEVEGEAADAARPALAQMLCGHPESFEALHIAVQITKRSSLDARFAELLATITPMILSGIERLGVAAGITRRDFIERRHVLLRAFDVASLRDVSVLALRSLLGDQNDQFKVERKDLAGNVLAAMRTLSQDLPSLKDLKHIAGVVFATGHAPTTATTAQAADLDNGTIVFVTAAQAESRKQFGLAEALEIRRCLALRNRPMSLEEYCLSLHFAPMTSGGSSNTSWLSRAEWNTVNRILVLASREEHLPIEAIAGLMYLLATRVKVEDPSDLRESHKRPDLIGAEEREKLLRESELLLRRLGIDPSIAAQVAIQLAPELLSREFSTFTYMPTDRGQSFDFAVGASGESRSEAQGKLLTLILNDDSPSVITRLLPEQIDAIRQVQGLSLEEFKIVTSRLRGRAVTCEWARMAILDLVRAPHDPRVGERVRTAVLGALINEARKAGRLTPQLEKDVFAVSAEIPALPFLQQSGTEEEATL